MSLKLRRALAVDATAIRGVHLDAFGGHFEADLVDALSSDAAAFVPELSLVAEEEGQVVGHCLCTRARVPGAPIACLGPIGVLKSHQRRRIGRALMEAMIDACRDEGFAAILLLGHPEYYPRFGFVPASRFGLSIKFEAPDECVMVLPLSQGALDGVDGLVEYPEAFG